MVRIAGMRSDCESKHAAPEHKIDRESLLETSTWNKGIVVLAFIVLASFLQKKRSTNPVGSGKKEGGKQIVENKSKSQIMTKALAVPVSWTVVSGEAPRGKPDSRTRDGFGNCLLQTPWCSSMQGVEDSKRQTVEESCRIVEWHAIVKSCRKLAWQTFKQIGG